MQRVWFAVSLGPEPSEPKRPRLNGVLFAVSFHAMRQLPGIGEVTDDLILHARRADPCRTDLALVLVHKPNTLKVGVGWFHPWFLDRMNHQFSSGTFLTLA